MVRQQLELFPLETVIIPDRQYREMPATTCLFKPNGTYFQEATAIAENDIYYKLIWTHDEIEHESLIPKDKVLLQAVPF